MRGPVDVFELMCAQWLAKKPFEDVLDDDSVIEAPFAPPGQPNRIEGRDAFRAYAEPQRAAFPVHFEDVRDVVVHETTDPEVIVVE